MKKSDLKTGMIIETRKGQTGLVVLDNVHGTDAIVFNEGNWTELRRFDEDTLEWHANGRWSGISSVYEYCRSVDIMKVYKPYLPTEFLSRDKSEMTLIWERKEVIEYTIDELFEIVGYEFKIIE